MTKTIVMIHGMWGGCWCWENYNCYFEEKNYQCFTPTLRYHDIDPKDKPAPELGKTSLIDYAQDLEEYIRDLDEKPLLMGHSMGGLLAQILAARGLAKGLILLTPSSPRGINAIKISTMKSFWSVISKWGYWRKPNRLSFQATVYSLIHLLPEADQEAAYKKFVYESGRAVFETGLWLFDSKAATRVDESKVTCPVLVVSGAKDRMTPASVVRKVADKYSAVSTYKEFENHAHWVIGEPGWESIAEFVYNWINQVEI